MRVPSRTVLVLVVVVLVALAGLVSYLVLVPSPSGNPIAPSGPSASCPLSTSRSPGGNWTTYHQNGSRAGVEPGPGVTSVGPRWSEPSPLDGATYAEPLLCGNAVYVATEEDSVYAFNATSGSLIWRSHLGTPVPGSSLPCGDIDPSGITGTPVIDRARGTLYAVAFLAPAHHVLFGLDLSNGAITSRVSVDPPGADPSVEQERGALALANGLVYVPFGGLDGDCGEYHGCGVGVPTNGSGALLSYEVPTSREGGIWSPAGITVGPQGDLFVATGNGASSTSFDYGDSVIELSPSLAVLGFFAPTTWASLNSGDTDLGSVAPAWLPDGAVFQIGKEGVGYLLTGDDLAGIGGQLYSANVCGGAYGGTAVVGATVLVPCVDGLVAVGVGASQFSVDWKAPGFDAGPPIVTGNVTWSIDSGSARLLGFNVTTGTEIFSFSLGSADGFVTPAASPGTLYVAGGNALYAFALN